MRRKLSLEELELELPKIETQETRFLLGGTGYSQDDISGHNNPVDNGHPHQDPLPPLNPDGPHHEGQDPVGEEMDESDIPGDDQDQGDYSDESGQHYPDPDDYGDYNPDPMNNNVQPPQGGNTNTNGNTGSGSNGSVPLPSGLNNGVDLSNFPFTFENSAQESNSQNFLSQLSSLFQSNGVIANLISQIEANGSTVNFAIADLVDNNGSNTLAQTEAPANTSNVTITFDSSDIGQNGWQNLFNNVNNANANGSHVHEYNNASQSLLNTVIHELTHGLIHSMMQSSVQIAVQNQVSGINGLYQTVVDNFGQNIADMFMYTDANGNAQYHNDATLESNQHDFMFSTDSNYDQYVQHSLSEFEQDIRDYERYLHELEARQQEEGPDGDGGPGHEEQGHN